MVLQGAHWQNQGRLILEAQGEFDAGRAPIENTGQWLFEEEAGVTQALSVLNDGSMFGAGIWHLEEVGLLVNTGEMGNGRDTLHLQAAFLHNRHQIKPGSLEATLSKGGENQGHMVTTTRTTLTCLGEWRNETTGIMHSQGQQTVLVLGNLINAGQIMAPHQTVTVKGVTVNTGFIEGRRSALDFAHLLNTGILGGGALGSDADFSLSVQSGKNTGDIASHGQMRLRVLGVFENEGHLTAQDPLTLTLDGQLINRNTITSKTVLATTGEGSLENHGTFQGDQRTEIGHADTDNHGLMVERGAVHLRPTKRFHNHRTGTVIAGSEMILSSTPTVEVINESGTDDAPGFGGQDIVFEEYQGTLINRGGRVTAERQIRGAVATVVNTGLVQAGVGYELAIQHLVNEGLWQGQGHVTIGEGRNLGRLDGTGLQVTVQQTLTNETSGSMTVQSLDGAGAFKNQGDLKGQGTRAQPMTVAVQTFENDSVFEPGEAVTFTEAVHSWLNTEAGTLDVDTIHFARAEGLTAQALNQGVLKAKQLSLERSLENEGTLATTHLTAQAPSLTNCQGATLTVLGSSTVTLEEFLNEGQAVFHGAVSGSIVRLINRTSTQPFDPARQEDDRDRLEFKALNTLTGTSLTNAGLLLAPQDLGWQGATLDNTGVMVTRSTALGFTHQLVNRGLWRWAEGDLAVGRRHVLNLNTFQKTPDLQAPYQGLTRDSRPADQTTVFHAGVFENRGQWVGDSQSLRAAGLINTGFASLSALSCEVEAVHNFGSFQITRGNLTGRIGGLENNGLLVILAGYFDVAGQTLTNVGQFKSQLGFRYTGTTLENRGDLLTPERLSLRLTGAAQNTGTLQADGGFDWQVRTFDHRQGQMIGHAKRQKSTIVVEERMTTAQGTDCQLHELDFAAGEWDHNGTLSLGAASSLRVGTFHHKGVVVAVENTQALLTLLTNDLHLQGVIAFHDMSVQTQRATSTKKGELIAQNRLHLKVEGSYTHHGLLQAQDFRYEAPRESVFLNQGRVLGLQTTSIQGRFQNKEGGVASLTGVTLEDGEDHLVNEGAMKLARIQSLGRGRESSGDGSGGGSGSRTRTEPGLVDVTNAPGATLEVKDCGHSEDVPDPRKGRELRGGGFAFGNVTNQGTIGFGGGTYHIRGTFTNTGVQHALPGQDLWYGDLINNGQIRSQRAYRIDHTRGKVTKLGKVRALGDLLLQLGDGEDAGRVLADNNPDREDCVIKGSDPVRVERFIVVNNLVSKEGKVRVEAKTFTAPYNMSLPGTWEFSVGSFICPYHVKAPHLKIWANYLDTGNGPNLGYIETTDGLLDVHVRKAKNTHGKLFGRRGVRLIVEDGDLENGASIPIPDPSRKGIIYGRNGAVIGSNGPIEIEVKKGNFYNRYGVVYSPYPFDIKVQGVVQNKAGHIRSGTSGRIKARKLEVTREDQGSQQYVSGYTTHVRKSGWGPFKSRSEYQEPNYATRTWEQSDEGVIDVSKETEGASGQLDLDCPEVFVTASSLLASGMIWSEVHKNYVFAGQGLPTGFHVHDRNGHAGKFFGLGGVHVKAGSMTISGSGGGLFVHLDSTDFLLECFNVHRRKDYPQSTLIFDIVQLIQAQATAQGFIQDRGVTRRGQPRFGFGIPVDQPAAQDKGTLVFLGRKPQNLAETEHGVEPGLLKMMTRQLMSHVMGLEGLRDDIIERFHDNARRTGREVLSQQEIEKQMEAMIVYKLHRIYHDLYDIAQRREELIGGHSDPIPEVRRLGEEEVKEELQPILSIPSAAQDYRAEGGGALVDDREGGEGVKVHVDRDATFRSGYVEAETFDIKAGRAFRAETKKRIEVNRCGNTVTIEEKFMPQATFIGRERGRVVARDHYEAVGVDFATGAGGGHFECTQGDRDDRAAVATTTVERTETTRGRRFCGVKVSGDRTTTDTTTSQEILKTRYGSLGPTEHHVPQGTHRRRGVVNEAVGELVYHAKHHEGDAAVAVSSQSMTTEKATLFGGSSHQDYREGATFVPNVSRSATGIRIEGETGVLRGEVFQTPKFKDNTTKSLELRMAKRELAHRFSSSRGNVFGCASVETCGGQEAGLPTVLLGVEGGKVDWFSAKGDSLIFESVIAGQVGKMVVKKNFRHETAGLRAWEQTTRESAGFSAPILQGHVRDPLVASVQGVGQGGHSADQVAAMLRGASEGTRAATDGFKILHALKTGNPLEAAKTLVSRWTSVTLSVCTSESSCRQSIAQPNVLDFEVLVLANAHSHLEGRISGRRLVALCDKLTTGPMASTAEAHHREQGGSASWNVLSFTPIPTLSIHQAKAHTEQRTHAPTTITVDQLFVRVNNAIFSGTQIRAKLVDAIVTGSLTIESVLDTFRSSHSGLDLSTIGDVRFADRDQVRDKINAVASLVGTQQFYLQVGQTLLTRSAEYGLRPDGQLVDSEVLTTADGQTFFVRPIPEEVDETTGGSLAVALGLTRAEVDQFFTDGDEERDTIAELTEVATTKGIRIVGWARNTTSGQLECIHSVGPRDGADEHATLNVLKTGKHYDLLETDPSRVEAAAFQHEVLPERDETTGTVINLPIGTAIALAGQLNDLQALIAQAHNQAKTAGASDKEALEAAEQVKEVQQELQKAEAELAQAEREAAQKIETRQRLREQAKRAGSAGGSSAAAASADPRDTSHIDALLQPDTQDQDILRDLAVRQREIVARHQAALEARTWVDGAVDIGLVAIETLKDIGQEIWDKPLGFVGAVAYEGLDFVVPGGIDAPTEWIRGERSFGSAFVRQSANVGAEVSLAYVGAKVLKLGYKGAKVLTRFTGKAMAKLEGKMGTKAAADSAHAVQKELETLAARAEARAAERQASYSGGSYGRLRQEKVPGIECHHMPADSVTNIPRAKGPAIQMEVADHRLTSSHGNSAFARAYRERMRGLVEGGQFRGAMAAEIKDVRRIGGTKYNQAIGEMLAGAKSQGLLKK